MPTKRASKTVPAVVVLFLCLVCPYIAAAQEEDDSKAIKAEVFIKERPTPSKKTPATARYNPALKSSSSDRGTVPPHGTTFAQLGVTFWRFRPSKAADK